MLIELLPWSGHFRKDGTPAYRVRMKCDICGNVFERTDKRFIDAKVHRCSKPCIYGYRKSDGIGGRGARVFEKSCSTCNTSLKRVESLADDEKWFCNGKCYGDWLSAHPESYAANTAKMWTAEAKIKGGRSISKFENRVAEQLVPLGWIQQHHISNFYVDFYHHQRDVVLEIFGDWWHAHPRFDQVIITKYGGIHPTLHITPKQRRLNDALRMFKLGLICSRALAVWESECDDKTVVELFHKYDA